MKSEKSSCGGLVTSSLVITFQGESERGGSEIGHWYFSPLLSIPTIRDPKSAQNRCIFDLTIALRSKSVRGARIRAQGGPETGPQPPDLISCSPPTPSPPNMRHLMLLFTNMVSFVMGGQGHFGSCDVVCRLLPVKGFTRRSMHNATLMKQEENGTTALRATSNLHHLRARAGLSVETFGG